MVRSLVPDDDLYARLELTPDATPEAVELAWRALLKRHHPDVAGNDVAALDRSKRINVAHDWLGDPELRARYDRERGVPRRIGVRSGRPPRGGPDGARRAPGTVRPRARPARPSRTDLTRGDREERLARFLDRVGRLTGDELDRLGAADPPPIAFLATIRRFLASDALEAFARTEAAVADRVPAARWADAATREALLGVAAELALGPFLDEHLDEPFRGRARDRLLRAWEASVDQPRLGPNAAAVEVLRARVARLSRDEASRFAAASRGVVADERPWPAAIDPDEDEGLRISALLASGDVAGALDATGLAPATTARLRRLLARLGHIVALRHAFPAGEYARLLRPWTESIGGRPAGDPPEPGVRRAR